MYEMISIFIAIGNSDDKLTQVEWAHFCHQLRHGEVSDFFLEVYGTWYSQGNDPWQNMCICADVYVKDLDEVRYRLRKLAKDYRQNSIALTIGSAEFISP